MGRGIYTEYPLKEILAVVVLLLCEGLRRYGHSCYMKCLLLFTIVTRDYNY